MKRLLLTALLLLASPAWAATIEDATAAYARSDYAAVLKITRPLAAKGEAWAQHFLGDSYYDGQGVVQDYAEAVKWYRLAAEQGLAMAQSNLGLMYEKGQGVLQDYAEAVRLYRLAATQGNAGAQTSLGVMYVKGHGVVQDSAEAVKWFKLAAAQGEPNAQHNLGVIEASPALITLSCIVESGIAAGVEFQYQINETAKTIWASRQEAPTQINIGPTEIRFKQGQADISISRNTGRYSNSFLTKLATGTCQTITQRKF